MNSLICETASSGPRLIVVDLFCGAGGTTTGFADTDGISAVIACVNHDPKAIKSHWMNHPEVQHYEEDITKLYGHVLHGTLLMSPQMVHLQRLVNIYRAFYPDAKVILWASLECTNFSKAKGGQPRDADSRTLAEHLDRYVATLDPDYIQIENVVEFMSWGPLTAKVLKTEEGYPCCNVKFIKHGAKAKGEFVGNSKYLVHWHGVPESKRSGQDYMRWRTHLCSFGYRDEWRELNSANYGAYTSRNRLFGIFAKPGLPIAWPEPTHTKHPGVVDLFSPLKKWKAVREVLDLEDEGKSIFNRKTSLVDASLERIYAGLVKFVAGGKDAFMLKYNSMSKAGKHHPPSLDMPCPVIPARDCLGIVNATFLAKYYSGIPSGQVKTIDSPADSLTTIDHHSVINAAFLQKHFSGKPEGKVIPVSGPAGTVCGTGNQSLIQVLPWVMNTNFTNIGHSINDPAQTLTASQHHPYVVSPAFLMQYYSNGGELGSLDEPGRTLGTKDTIAKGHVNFLDKTYSGHANIASIDSPAGVIMPNDKHRLIQCEELILNPSHGGHSTSIMAPCPTIVASQHKAPLYLIQVTVSENVCIPVYDDDSEVMVRIKIFMALYGIGDIKMRMLKVPELLMIQGFPADYQLFGNQSDQKKFIGNSVVPLVVKEWAIALSQKTNDQIPEVKEAA